VTPAPDLPGSLLLLSGGLDSTALAAWIRPAAALWIDYGQRPAGGELRAARSVAGALGLPLSTVTVDARQIGLGLLNSDDLPADAGTLPSPEWWPFRNQLLVTVAAAWAWPRGHRQILVGSVRGDGERHADGRSDFYEALATVLALQEGGLTVSAPAVAMTTAGLVQASGAPDSLLAWCHSCHVSDLACGGCPGCVKNETVLASLGRFSS
jgi:7-cyano-7-deazaguanine synthase